jgi:hypothetical protein
MTAQSGYNASSADASCYEGMLGCLGAVFGTIGSFPLCFCFPKYSRMLIV